MDESQAWRIRVPPERLPALRNDEAFRQVLALGRFLNSLRFCQFAMIQWEQLDTPAGQRQRSAVFFIAASLLHEGLQLIKRMRKHFRDLPSWGSSLQPILADRCVETLLSDSIIPVRNQTVFHFGADAYIEPLRQLDHDTLVLASSVGPQQGEVSYELSDLLAYHLMIGGAAPTAEEHLVRATELIQRTVDLVGSMTMGCEAIINDYCTRESLVAELLRPDGTWHAA